MIAGLAIDGVLADFITPFLQLLAQEPVPAVRQIEQRDKTRR
jgi:hypothetical protein